MKTIKHVAVFAVFGLAGTAYADGITLTPGDCDTSVPGGNCWVIADDPTPGAPVANPDTDEVEVIVGETDDLASLFKTEVGDEENPDSIEEGTFYADSYTIEFFNTSLDPQDALISWDGPDTMDCITQACYLMLRDGNHDPNVYIFDISGWDGESHIHLSGFWPDQGAISYASMFGGEQSNLPEPGTLALLGLGLVGMGIIRRRGRRTR